LVQRVLGFRVAILISSLAMFIATPVAACRFSESPDVRVDTTYKAGIISSVAVVRTARASYIRKPLADAQPWRASANVERVLTGQNRLRVVTFERGWGSAACDNRTHIARHGEQWVIYFWRKPDRTQAVWASYPAEVALRVDPQITRAKRQ
jgi:hypothetical protein